MTRSRGSGLRDPTIKASTLDTLEYAKTQVNSPVVLQRAAEGNCRITMPGLGGPPCVDQVP